VLARFTFIYLNTRIRARRGRMLPESFFQQALGQTFPGFLRMLAETVYGADLIGDTLGDVDRAVSNHLTRDVADLPTLVSGKIRELISLPLLRADLINLKAILRGKQSGKTPEEIRAGLLGGTLKEPVVAAMLQAPDAAGVAQVLQLPVHPLARALRKALAETTEPLALEVALDRDFFVATLEKAKKLRQPQMTAFLTLELDLTNLLTAFKLQALGARELGLEKYFVPGGKWVSRLVFERIASGDHAALETLGTRVLRPVSGARTLTELERATRSILLEQAAKHARDTRGVGLALDFILRKQWEASRVRLLARRAYYNLPADAVAREIT
jgi:V/A-type H+-transporting ATPase subunit C